jgi:hypothetical protein
MGDHTHEPTQHKIADPERPGPIDDLVEPCGVFVVSLQVLPVRIDEDVDVTEQHYAIP